MPQWKPINKYPNYYVSDTGEVMGMSKQVLVGVPCHGGYLGVILCKPNYKPVRKQVHRLVAKAFIPNPESKPCVNHIDGDKRNNYISNLEWVTYSENQKHSWKIGLNKGHTGKTHKGSKLSVQDRDEIVNSNLSNKEIALQYNISLVYVNKLKRKEYLKGRSNTHG